MTMRAGACVDGSVVEKQQHSALTAHAGLELQALLSHLANRSTKRTSELQKKDNMLYYLTHNVR